MRWSEGSTNSKPSGLSLANCIAARKIAGAVFLEDGSNMILLSKQFSSLAWFKAMDLYLELVTINGDENSSVLQRWIVRLKRLSFLSNAMNCLGFLLFDNGQSLEPSPPDRITGVIFIFAPLLF